MWLEYRTMLAGSFASGIHGAPRSTQDIYLVIDPTFESLDRLLAALSNDDHYVGADVAREELEKRGQFNVIDLVTSWKADLIFRKAKGASLDLAYIDRWLDDLGVRELWERLQRPQKT
jgi:hypothetical protein